MDYMHQTNLKFFIADIVNKFVFNKFTKYNIRDYISFDSTE